MALGRRGAIVRRWAIASGHWRAKVQYPDKTTSVLAVPKSDNHEERGAQAVRKVS